MSIPKAATNVSSTATMPSPTPTAILNINLTTTIMPTSSTSNATVLRHATTYSLRSAIHTHMQSISWRLRQYCIQAFTASSRRRRRRHDDINNNNHNNITTNISSSNCTNSSLVNTAHSNTALPTAAQYDHNNNHSNNNSNNNNNNNNYNLSKVTICSPAKQLFKAIAQALSSSSIAATYIAALLVLTACCSFCAASPCDLHSWWDPLKDKCIPCTVCEGEMIPLRPCQLHRDTICGSIYDLKIDWVVLAKTEPNWKERRKEDGNIELEQHLSNDELQQLHDESLPMDWQTTALFLAVLACLLFFVVAAGILVHHMRQWRRMERRLDQDVEELSTKLMAKLAEVQSMEGGTFFIGNADALRVPTTFQPQHVLLPEKSAKNHERRILKTLQPGNVYIEENGSKG